MKHQEYEDRDYIGMYEIVANKLKKDARNAREKFTADVIQKFIRPLMNKNVQPVYEAEDPKRGLMLICAKDLGVAIGALKVTDDKGVTRLRYYVVLPASHEIYEWTKFSRVLKKNDYAVTIMYDEIFSLTKEEDYNDQIIEDKQFWNNHVLLKESGQYKYLKSLK